MSGFARVLLIGLSITVVIVGAFLIAFAADVSEASSFNECMRVSRTLIRCIAGISTAVAVVGIIGASFKLKVLEYFYLFALLSSTAAALLLCLFAWAILPNATAFTLFAKVTEHGVWLPEYGMLMQKTVANQMDWTATKDCFRRIDTCTVMGNQTEERKEVYIEYGCCLPAIRCGLEQASTGAWVMPSTHGLNATDDECLMWVRVGKSCFECDSCKAAYLAYYQNQWEVWMYLRIACVVFLIASSALAYYILFVQDHNYQTYGLFNGHKLED